MKAHEILDGYQHKSSMPENAKVNPLGMAYCFCVGLPVKKYAELIIGENEIRLLREQQID